MCHICVNAFCGFVKNFICRKHTLDDDVMTQAVSLFQEMIRYGAYTLRSPVPINFCWQFVMSKE